QGNQGLKILTTFSCPLAAGCNENIFIMITSGKSCQQTACQTLIFVADNKSHLLIKDDNYLLF
ncbi:MAG: hypothetical protein ACKO7A_12485, partial [Microcystis sp.]